MIEFQVPGPAVGKARARIFTVKTKSGGVFHRGVTPKTTVNYENWVRTCFLQAKPDDFSPYTCPVCLHIRVLMPVPASFSRKKREEAIKGLVLPQKKPDWDNYGKIFSDALSGFAYLDDKQVVYGSVWKVYGERPTAFVRVEPV